MEKHRKRRWWGGKVATRNLPGHSHAIKLRLRIKRTENSYKRTSSSCPANFVSFLTDWQAALNHERIKHHNIAGLRKQLQENWTPELLCLSWSEPSFLLCLTYTHSYKCPLHLCYGVSMHDTHSPALQKPVATGQVHLFVSHSDVHNKSITARVMLLCAPAPGTYKVASPATTCGTSAHSIGTCRGGWLSLAEQSCTLSQGEYSTYSVGALKKWLWLSRADVGSKGGVIFWARRSQYALLLLLPTQETAVASFFNPAQVRPDFPVWITTALVTFHTPKRKTLLEQMS